MNFMSLRLILPNTYLDNLNAPLVFLVGPIKLAPLWQDAAIEKISTTAPDLYIVSPSKHVREGFFKNSLRGEQYIYLRASIIGRRIILSMPGSLKIGRKE